MDSERDEMRCLLTQIKGTPRKSFSLVLCLTCCVVSSVSSTMDSNKKKKNNLPVPQLGVASPQEKEGSQDHQQQNHTQWSSNQQPCAESTLVLRGLRDFPLGRVDSRARSYRRRGNSP